MYLKPIERAKSLSPEDFHRHFLSPGRPLILSGAAQEWPALRRWSWAYLKAALGHMTVGVCNNRPADPWTSSSAPDDTMLLSDFIDFLQRGSQELRVCGIRLRKHAPQLLDDFSFPNLLPSGTSKPDARLMLAAAGAVLHMHFDLSLAHHFQTQFLGRTRVLLFPQSQTPLLYRMPMTGKSAADFMGWEHGVDTQHFPALQKLRGYEAILEPGEMLFIPSGCWQHLQCMEAGIALNLRSLPEGALQRLNALSRPLPLAACDEILIRLVPRWWYQRKRWVAAARTAKVLRTQG